MKKTSAKAKKAEPVLTKAARAIGSTIGKIAAKTGLTKAAPAPAKKKTAAAKPRKTAVAKKLARPASARKTIKAVQ